MASLVAKLTAELLGTFAFLTVILNYPTPVTIGLGLMIILFFIAGISGGHVNPAITTTMWLAGRINGENTIMYIISQVLGGALAYAVFRQLPLPALPLIY